MELRSYGERYGAVGEKGEIADMRVEAVYRAVERGGRRPRRPRCRHHRRDVDDDGGGGDGGGDGDVASRE